MSAALMAGGILGGSLIGAGSTKNTNQANQDFAKEMSSTQYQRAVEDMRAAGINPVMAAGTGGASSSGVTNTAPGESIATGLQNAARMINETNQATANIKQQEANTEVAKAAVDRTKEETRLTRANTAVQQSNAKIRSNEVSESNVRSAPWKVGDVYVSELQKGGPAAPNTATTRHIPAGKKPQNSNAATANGKGTVYGGANSAQRVTQLKGKDDW
ncbi:MAG: DNA pilot protein [Microviridae sp.]|nr:MAG: DNA pilot protein [Microviridae sp.]